MGGVANGASVGGRPKSPTAAVLVGAETPSGGGRLFAGRVAETGDSGSGPPLSGVSGLPAVAVGTRRLLSGGGGTRVSGTWATPAERAGGTVFTAGTATTTVGAGAMTAAMVGPTPG